MTTGARRGCEPTIIGGRYEIADPERDLLGCGGMGDVYRGTDLQTGERVSIKALRPEVVAAAQERVCARDLEATVKELLGELEG